MKGEEKIGPEFKNCTYPRGGKECGVPFERPANMANGNWKQCTRCPKCRILAKSGGHKPAEQKLGHYEVKNEALDRFLYG
jgi:hypothetical protein